MLEIALCFDKKYLAHAAVTTQSCLSNTNSKLKINWITESENTEEAIETIKKIKNKNNSSIDVINISNSFFDNWKECHHFTKGMYYRLILPTVIKSSKVLYLDCDTLVQSDLSALFNVDLKNNFLAGIIDEGGTKTSQVPRKSGDPYLNSGVLLMNLDLMRHCNFLDLAVNSYPVLAPYLTWPDQCLINKLTEGAKISLDAKWNRQIFSNSLPKESLNNIFKEKNSKILHFVGGIKPWQKWCNPSAVNLWKKYATKIFSEDSYFENISTIDQLLMYGDVLHLNHQFQEASEIKSNTIRELIAHINK